MYISIPKELSRSLCKMIIDVIMTSAYITLTTLLKRHMLYRPAYSLTDVLKFHNVIQILCNTYVTLGLINIPFLPSEPNIFAINAPYTTGIHHYITVHFFTKYMEYFDTFLIILSGKQVSFLHKYHRVYITLLWSFLSVTGHTNGTAGFIALTNSFVNIIMYSHHLLQSPYKKMVTQTQIALIIILVSHSVCIVAYEDIFPKEYALIEFLYQIQMLTLFTDYYLSAYSRKHYQYIP